MGEYEHPPAATHFAGREVREDDCLPAPRGKDDERGLHVLKRAFYGFNRLFLVGP